MRGRRLWPEQSKSSDGKNILDPSSVSSLRPSISPSGGTLLLSSVFSIFLYPSSPSLPLPSLPLPLPPSSPPLHILAGAHNISHCRLKGSSQQALVTASHFLPYIPGPLGLYSYGGSQRGRMRENIPKWYEVEKEGIQHSLVFRNRKPLLMQSKSKRVQWSIHRFLRAMPPAFLSVPHICIHLRLLFLHLLNDI